MATSEQTQVAGEQAPVTRHERMSAVDTAWLRMDGAGNAMMIVSVTATATPVKFAEFRHIFATRLLCYPRFRHRPVQDPLGASWVADAGFDLDAHLIRTELPEPCGKTELEEFAADLASVKLPADRPLWQVHFVDRYQSGSAWVMRLHHCYADGIAMIRVLLSLTEQDSGPALAGAQDPELHPPHRGKGRKASRIAPDLLPLLNWVEQLSRPAGDILESALAEGARLLENGVHRLFHPEQTAMIARQAGGMVGEFARVLALPDDPVTPLRGHLSGVKRVAWAEPLDLQEVKTVGKALNCTVNDVLMATVAGALGAHLRATHRLETAGLKIRASVPVNLRAAEEPMTLGNKFGLVFVELPIGIENPLQRVYAVHDTMRALKGSLQPPMTLMVLGMMGMVPAALQGPAIELFSRKGSVVASNVPGPQAPLYMCGQEISEMYFWVPQSGSMGIGISILSYAGKVFFGMIADRRLVADPQSVVDRFQPEFEKLLLAVTVGALALQTAATPAAVAKKSRPRSQGKSQARAKERPTAHAKSAQSASRPTASRKQARRRKTASPTEST
jgi:diacylglycerol O-acyltransferase / wax synthase